MDIIAYYFSSDKKKYIRVLYPGDSITFGRGLVLIKIRKQHKKGEDPSDDYRLGRNLTYTCGG
jgi:hypothetical protein